MKGLVPLLVLTFSGALFAQTPHFRKHPLPLEFKNASINCLLQDKAQFMWFGTSIGLVRYDGLTHKNFLQFPGEDNTIHALYQDSKRNLWVGYKSGRIAVFTHNRFQTAAFRFSNSITDFVEDDEGHVWASSYGSGIAVFQKQDTFLLNSKNGLPDDYVYALVKTSDGQIIAGTDQGLAISDGSVSAINSFNTDHGLPDNIVTALSVDGSGNILIGTESEGISRLDLKNRKIIARTSSWPYGRVNTINTIDETVWAGTAMHGIIELSPEFHPRKLYNENRNVPLKISDVIKDHEGNIWLAGGTSSVLSAHRLFSFFKPAEKDVAPIQAILSSRNGTLWWSTGDGLFFKSPGNPVEQVNAREFRTAQIISLFEDAHGWIWCGTFDKGVLALHPSTGKVFALSENGGLINNNVLSITGNQNELWFATLGGVSKCVVTYKGTTISTVLQNYTSENGLGSNYIYKVFIDSKKRVWFTTDGKGVTVLEGVQFKNFSLTEGLKSNIVYSITEDSSGKIWVSTANAGVFRFNGSAFQAFTPHNGLRDLSISSIAGEKNGKLLIVSKQGVDILDPASGAVFYHGEEFGIGAMDPNLNAYAYDGAGNIWLGTDKGILLYNANIPQMQQWPVTKINDVQLFLSSIDTVKRTFSHDENHISFDYMGFWYHDPAEVSYQVKLEGYDREWINSKNHFITYPNLAPGEYTFLVKSSATNHFAGSPVSRFSFSISPPFYNTAIFYVFSLVLITISLYWIVKTRERRLKDQERLEKEKVQFQFETLKNQVNPHFLFNSFNTLIGVIEQHPEEAVEYVEKLSDFYRDILVNREKDVIAVADELDMIRNYYFLQLKRFKSNFQMIVSVDDDAKTKLIPPLTLQLLVENAIKHNVISTDHPLTVWIGNEGDYLVVKNTLKKKIVNESSTGLGLSNIINRFSLLTRQQVKVVERESYFSVYVPLIS